MKGFHGLPDSVDDCSHQLLLLAPLLEVYALLYLLLMFHTGNQLTWPSLCFAKHNRVLELHELELAVVADAVGLWHLDKVFVLHVNGQLIEHARDEEEVVLDVAGLGERMRREKGVGDEEVNEKQADDRCLLEVPLRRDVAECRGNTAQLECFLSQEWLSAGQAAVLAEEVAKLDDIALVTLN